MFNLNKYNVPEYLEISDGVRVLLRKSKRAKNISMRLDDLKREVILTIPFGTSVKRAEKFAIENKKWIKDRINSMGEEIALKDGDIFNILGQKYTLNNIEKTKDKPIAFFDDDYLCVQGDSKHLKRRTIDFLKQMARNVMSEKSNAKAELINKEIKRIRVADQKTRWGSCTHDGVLSYSWRLILCPEHVLDYVIAHEVAHLEHMNHSKEFWKLCQELSENSNVKSKQWLKQNGKETRRILV